MRKYANPWSHVRLQYITNLTGVEINAHEFGMAVTCASVCCMTQLSSRSCYCCFSLQSNHCIYPCAGYLNTLRYTRETVGVQDYCLLFEKKPTFFLFQRPELPYR